MNVMLTQTIAGVDRLFGLDLQLLADLAIELIAVFVLFTAMSNLLFNPAREFLKKRQEKIKGEMEFAAKEKEDAIALKAEYTAKLNDVQKEAEEILSETRKKALKISSASFCTSLSFAVYSAFKAIASSFSFAANSISPLIFS